MIIKRFQIELLESGNFNRHSKRPNIFIYRRRAAVHYLYCTVLVLVIGLIAARGPWLGLLDCTYWFVAKYVLINMMQSVQYSAVSTVLYYWITLH